MTEQFALWMRSETAEDAAAQGRAWADAEPRWVFLRVVSVEPAAFHGVWTVTVEMRERDERPLTLGLVTA